MKIGLVCPYNFFRPGGVQEVVRALHEELTTRGHTVRIITPRPRLHDEEPPKDILFVGQSTKFNTPIKTTMDIGATFPPNRHLDEILAAEQFDVLHIHEPEVPILGGQILSHAMCPTVATFHAIHPETPMGKTIEAFRIPFARSIFKNITLMTAVSDVAAVFVREWSKQEVQIIPNGIDLHKYSQARQNPLKTSRNKTIFYIGRLEKRKGVRYLLQAYHLLTKTIPGTQLIIAGDGPEKVWLETYANNNHLSGVSFLGFISDEQKRQLFVSADLFCSPAIFGESFGIVLLEALALGCVTVAGNNPGYESVMAGRGALSIVDPKDTEEFARRLQLLLTDEGLRNLWKEWAAEYVLQFDYPKVIDLYEDAYKQALRKAV